MQPLLNNCAKSIARLKRGELLLLFFKAGLAFGIGIGILAVLFEQTYEMLTKTFREILDAS